MAQEIKITQTSNADMNISVPKNLTALQSFWNKIALKLSVEQINEFLPEFQEAKTIEKEQIIKAASTVLWHNTSNSTNQAEQYYNETYKK